MPTTDSCNYIELRRCDDDTATGMFVVKAPNADGWRSDDVTPYPTSTNPYLFTGQRYDPEIELHYFKARTYHQRLGRFIQRDPIGYVDGMNLYAAYFAMWGGVDPMGLIYRWTRDWVLGIDSRMIEQNQAMLAARAREAAERARQQNDAQTANRMDEIARDAEQTGRDFSDQVGARALEAATSCKRRCGESVLACSNRIGESADIQDQLFNAGIDLGLNAVGVEGYASPTSPSDIANGTALADAAVGAGVSFARDTAIDSINNARVGPHITRSAQALTRMATGIDGGSAGSMINSMARRQAQRVAGQNAANFRNALRGAGRGLRGGLAGWLAWETGLRAGALLAHCSCEPECCD